MSDNGNITYEPPAFCTHPDCNAKINRGLKYVCGGDVMPTDFSCGQPFCDEHATEEEHICERCVAGEEAYPPKSTVPQPESMQYQLTADDWALWRERNPDQVQRLRDRLAAYLATHGGG